MLNSKYNELENVVGTFRKIQFLITDYLFVYLYRIIVGYIIYPVRAWLVCSRPACQGF